MASSLSSLFVLDATDRPRYLVHLAFLTALAVSMYLLEMLIPKPMPFMTLGLANIVVLLLLLHHHPRAAIIVALGKTVVGGLFSGMLLSPTTALSLAGTLLSFGFMLIALRLPLGILGISICGAVGHNFGQLLMVRLLLVPNDGIFHLTPLLIIVGMVTGIITGSIAWKVVQAVKGDYEEIHR
jgi:heptaprenyl diphosphate synthase